MVKSTPKGKKAGKKSVLCIEGEKKERGKVPERREMGEGMAKEGTQHNRGGIQGGGGGLSPQFYKGKS